MIRRGFIDEALAIGINSNHAWFTAVPNVWEYGGGTISAGANRRWEPQGVFAVVIAKLCADCCCELHRIAVGVFIGAGELRSRLGHVLLTQLRVLGKAARGEHYCLAHADTVSNPAVLHNRADDLVAFFNKLSRQRIAPHVSATLEQLIVHAGGQRIAHHQAGAAVKPCHIQRPAHAEF